MDANKIFEIPDTDIAIEEIRERIKKNLEKRSDPAIIHRIQIH